MRDNPNTVTIGAFIIGAVLIAISTFIFINSSGWGSHGNKVVMAFEESVKGLSVGAPIALRGVQIGQVTDIRLIFDTDTIEVITIVEADIDKNTYETKGNLSNDISHQLVDKGLRAQLGSQSLLTGLLYIQLDFHPNSGINLVKIDSPYAQIPTIPTDLQRITQELQSMNFGAIAKDIESIASGIEHFINIESVKNLPDDLHNTLISLTAMARQFETTVERFVGAEAFQKLPDDLHSALNSITKMTHRLTVQIDSSGPKLDKVLVDASKSMDTFNTEIPKISSAAITTLTTLQPAIVAFEQTMSEINALVSDDSATIYRLRQALREVALAGRELQLLAKTLEEHPEALIRGLSKDKE
ncbi:MAG: MCE family protein [Methylophaga sp.]|nr:MCE family protein [Methylophaga sp.]